MAQNELSLDLSQQVQLDVPNKGTPPLAQTYTNAVGGNIDLTTYAFTFFLQDVTGTQLAVYSLASGIMTNAFLTKGGAGNATLTMTGMLTDTMAKILPFNSVGFKWIMLVTDAGGNNYVQIVYNLNVVKY